MTLDQWLMLAEVILLIRVLWQGEYILRYERGTYELHAARDKERRDWRDAKKRAAIKKIENTVVEEKKNGGH